MPPEEGADLPALTISEIEEQINEAALRYARNHYSLPVTAFRVFLWPKRDFHVTLFPGPTARIIIHVPPYHKDFHDDLTRAIDRVATQKLYSTMAVESMAHILDREQTMRRWLKEHYNFEPELIPHMLRDDELTVRRVERLEIIHKPTGMREVIEVEQGSGRATYAGREIAKTRLARRVHEKEVADKRAKDNEIPFHQSA